MKVFFGTFFVIDLWIIIIEAFVFFILKIAKKNTYELVKVMKCSAISCAILLFFFFVSPQETEEPVISPTPTAQVIKESREDYISSCQEYTYKYVLRTPEYYAGKRIKIKLQISSVHEESFLQDKYYFAYSENEYGWYGDRYAVYDKRENGIKLLEGDVIYVYGEIDGTVHTSSLILKSQELVSIKMKYSELIQQ